MATANTDRDWDAKYLEGNTPWDSGLASKELRRTLDELGLHGGRALELGCGTGTNAVYLATRGFDVTAVDCVAQALEHARQKATEAHVEVTWVEADVQQFGDHLDPVDFVFDRGCYHCCRRVDLNGYLETLQNVTQPGSILLVLSGNANEQTEYGPPRVTDAEIREDFSSLFEIELLREFYFEDPGGVQGPLGWSARMVRK